MGKHYPSFSLLAILLFYHTSQLKSSKATAEDVAGNGVLGKRETRIKNVLDICGDFCEYFPKSKKSI